jgi:hypothetical protein
VGGRRRLRQKPGLTIEFCLILLSRGLYPLGDLHRNLKKAGFSCAGSRWRGDSERHADAS